MKSSANIKNPIRAVFVLALCAAFLAPALPAFGADPESKLDPELRDAVALSDPDETIPVTIFFEEPADLSEQIEAKEREYLALYTEQYADAPEDEIALAARIDAARDVIVTVNGGYVRQIEPYLDELVRCDDFVVCANAWVKARDLPAIAAFGFVTEICCIEALALSRMQGEVETGTKAAQEPPTEPATEIPATEPSTEPICGDESSAETTVEDNYTEGPSIPDEETGTGEPSCEDESTPATEEPAVPETEAPTEAESLIPIEATDAPTVSPTEPATGDAPEETEPATKEPGHAGARPPHVPHAPKGYMVGDVDRDWDVTSSDARLALRFSVGLSTPAFREQFLSADVDEDGRITAADARMILRVAVGLDSFIRR